MPKLLGKEVQVFWVAKLNDYINCGETLCELEVQKATVEISAPCNGRLVKICIDDGGYCTAGSFLGYIAKEDW